MVLGLSIIHVLVLMVLLVSIALPFLLVAHARHARAQVTIILLDAGLVGVVFAVWLACLRPFRPRDVEVATHLVLPSVHLPMNCFRPVMRAANALHCPVALWNAVPAHTWSL